MLRIHVHNASTDRELGSRIALADGFLTRLRGMIGRPPPEEGEGMLIAPSQGVHMWWMKYPLDVALLDRDGEVLETYPDLQPGKRTRILRKARYALELPVGTLAESGTEVGHLLRWDRKGDRNGDGANSTGTQGTRKG